GFGPEAQRGPPSFLERISSMETEAFWPSPAGPDVAGSSILTGRGGVVGPDERPEGGAEAGEGLPASAAPRPPPGKADEGTSLPVRGGEGSGGSRRNDDDDEADFSESRRITRLTEAGWSRRYLVARRSMRSASLR